jgi:hypothetical protein
MLPTKRRPFRHKGLEAMSNKAKPRRGAKVMRIIIIEKDVRVTTWSMETKNRIRYHSSVTPSPTSIIIIAIGLTPVGIRKKENDSDHSLLDSYIIQSRDSMVYFKNVNIPDSLVTSRFNHVVASSLF